MPTAQSPQGTAARIVHATEISPPIAEALRSLLDAFHVGVMQVRKQPAGSGSLGVGILGMRERMRQLGGRREITSGGSGTIVKAALALCGEDSDVSTNPLGG